MFATLIAAGAMAWSSTIARVDMLETTKAERAEVTRDIQRIERVLERLDERTARMDRFLCRQIPTDLGCP
jgi:hypothetical protein